LGAPRISDADYLEPAAVAYGHHEGAWIRVAQYKKGHRVSVQGDSARCGLGLVVEHEWWQTYRKALASQYGVDPGPYYIALDARAESSRCTPCKKGKDLYVRSKASSAHVVGAGALPVSGADRLAERRLDMVVRRVAAELGAEVL